MDIHQLELFLAVMEEKSVTRAAAKMSLTAGAVSLQLHSLSAELRTELFSRSGKRLVPTSNAFRLATHAQSVVTQMRQIRQEFDNDPFRDTQPFHIATGATTLIHRLGRPLRSLRKQYQHAEIHVTVAATEEIVAGLIDRSFDLGLISLPFSQENLTVTPLFEEELLLLRPSPTRIRRNTVRTIDVSELVDVPFLLYPPRSNMRTMINGFLKDIGVTPRVVMEADDTEVIKRLVEAGFGYSILPQKALRDSSRFYQTLRVRGHKLARIQALAMVRTDHPRGLTLSIAAFLKSALDAQKKRAVEIRPAQE